MLIDCFRNAFPSPLHDCDHFPVRLGISFGISSQSWWWSWVSYKSLLPDQSVWCSIKKRALTPSNSNNPPISSKNHDQGTFSSKPACCHRFNEKCGQQWRRRWIHHGRHESRDQWIRCSENDVCVFVMLVANPRWPRTVVGSLSVGWWWEGVLCCGGSYILSSRIRDLNVRFSTTCWAFVKAGLLVASIILQAESLFESPLLESSSPWESSPSVELNSAEPVKIHKKT